MATYLRHTEWANAKTIREEFPDVEEIKIEVSYENTHPRITPKPEKMGFGPENKALFKLNCHNPDCSERETDIFSVIYRMIQERSESETGSKTCGGWQDRRRKNKYHCCVKMNYKIAIKYK